MIKRSLPITLVKCITPPPTRISQRSIVLLTQAGNTRTGMLQMRFASETYVGNTEFKKSEYQKSIYQKCLHLNKLNIDTSTMTDQFIFEMDLNNVDRMCSLFWSNGISKEVTGEVISAHPKLVTIVNHEIINQDFDFWKSLLGNKEYPEHISKYPLAAFYNPETGSEIEYRKNRIEITELLANEIEFNFKMIGRIIAGCPEFFESNVDYVKTQLDLLRSIYDKLKGKNFTIFCRVQLAQSIRLLDRPESFDALINQLKALHFQNEEILKILPKFAGILSELEAEKMESIERLLINEFELDSKLKLKEMIIISPTLLTLEKTSLEQRISSLNKEWSL